MVHTRQTAVAFLLLILASCSTQGRQTSVPADFAFRFSYGTCITYTLDTFEQTFTRDSTYRSSQITIPLALDEAQVAAIYARIEEIDLWSYPETFAIHVPPGTERVEVDPFMKYRITVRARGETKELSWSDEIVKPTTPEADRLRGLFRQIMDMANEHPNVRNLPTPPVGCL